jgi:hypothetical protein
VDIQEDETINCRIIFAENIVSIIDFIDRKI